MTWPMYVALAAALFSSSCGGQAEAAQSSAQPTSWGLLEYAQACRERIGVIPELDARKGVVIPITVNGQVPETYTPHMDCDCPSLLPGLGCDGQCVPYSRLQLVHDDSELQIVALFRRTILRDEEDPLFDEIDLIVHSVTNGDTGWFQATTSNPDCDPRIGVNGHHVPIPGAPGSEEFWNHPDVVVEAKCGVCHDNDPFYYSPYVAQVQSHLPADPLGKYNNAIGPFKAWPALKSLETRGNTCTGCHRIGVHHTSKEGLLSAVGWTPTAQGTDVTDRYPGSHWMPAHNFLTQSQWDAVYEESAELLFEWHAAPGAADYEVEPIPHGGGH